MNTMNSKDCDFIARQIRAQYTHKENTRLDELKALDRKVKKPGGILAWVLGSLGAIIMGAGMSLVMTDLPAAERGGLQVCCHRLFSSIFTHLF